MMKQMSRLSRLSSILIRLQSKRLVNATELSEAFHVSVRTIYRDMRSLEDAGVPIISVEGKGYSLMDGYNVPPVMFTEDEANALITAEHLILKNKDSSLSESYASAIVKIRSVLRHTQKESSELLTNRIQVRNNIQNDKTSHYLIALQSHITRFELIQIQYLSLQNEYTEREVEPFALYTTQNNWILLAFCRKRNSFRAFRLDCIQGIRPTHLHFEPHKMTLEEYFEECRKKWLNTPDIPLS